MPDLRRKELQFQGVAACSSVFILHFHRIRISVSGVEDVPGVMFHVREYKLDIILSCRDNTHFRTKSLIVYHRSIGEPVDQVVTAVILYGVCVRIDRDGRDAFRIDLSMQSLSVFSEHIERVLILRI